MRKTQVDFLRKRYPEVVTVQKLLETGTANPSDDEDIAFEVPIELFNAFWNWLEDESVFTLDKDDEPTHTVSRALLIIFTTKTRIINVA